MIEIFSDKTFGLHRYGASQKLAPETIKELVEVLHQPVGKARSVLGGRSSVTIADLDKLGSVAVKHFTRGGVLGKFVSKRYLRLGPTRPEREFRLMQKVRELGVHAPEPIAFFFQGCPFYRGWLVTREVANHKTLAELSLEGDEGIDFFMEELARQVEVLIRHKIFHVDLHPGNVLIDDCRVVHLVDFDKAGYFPGPMNLLRDKYLIRWRRAVIKHKLPDTLSELFSALLRKKFGGEDE